MVNSVFRILAVIELLAASYLYHSGQEWQFAAFAASFCAIAGNWRT